MFRKIVTMITAISLVLNVTGSAFATWGDLKLIRVYYERTTGTVELATNLGNIEDIAQNQSGTTAGSFGTVVNPANLYAAYWAVDRSTTTPRLWVSGSPFTAPVAVGTQGFTSTKSGAKSVLDNYNIFGAGVDTLTMSQTYVNSYRLKLSSSQGSLGNGIDIATRPYTEAKLGPLLDGTVTSVSQPLYYFSNPNTAKSKGVPVATITTNADGSTVISPPKKLQTITVGTIPEIAVGSTGTISATSDSGLDVTLTSKTTDICTVSGATVTGVSDGVCTIAANQAGNGEFYPAGEVTNSFALASPVNGACGSSNGQISDAAPTENLCSAGTAGAVSGTGPWTWTCAGSNGGTTASCSSSNVPKTGQTMAFTPPAAKTYGDAPINLSGFATGGASGNPVTFEIIGTGPGHLSGENNATLTITGAGTITIKASQAGNTTYDAAPDVQKDIVVSPRGLTITADAKTKVYGASDPILTYTAGGLISGDTVTGTLSRAAGENVGDYAISQGTLAASANYSITYSGTNLSITPAPLTVIAGNASRPYGAANPVDPGFTAPDLAGTDTITGVTYTYAATATPTAIVGSTHAITPSAARFGSGSASNYAITYVDGLLTVTGSTAQSISFSPPSAATYGDAPIVLSATASSGLPVTLTLVSGPAKLNGAELTITGARTITVKASQAGDATYAAAPDVVRTITVSPRDLAITAKDASRAYGEGNPANPGFTAPGLVGADSIGSVTYNYAATATATAIAGTTHLITPSAALFATGSAGNYTITYISGTLTIEKASQTISFSPPSTAAYGSTPISLSGTGGRSGNPVTFSVVSGPATLSGNQLTLAGAGTVTVKASQAGNSNYAAAPDVEKDIAVSPKALTITAKNATRAYGDPNPADPGFTATGLVGTDTITGVAYVYAATATSTAGVGSTHSITPDAARIGTGKESSYAITYKPGTLTIGKSGQTIGPITFSGETLAVKGSVTASATATSGLPVTFTSKTPDVCASVNGSTVFTGLKAGTCTISASQAGDANYAAATTVTQDIATLFPQITFAVTATVDAERNNGSIVPVPPAPRVNPGDKASFTLIPNRGYQVGTISSTCARGFFDGSTYTTGAINADCAISAAFVAQQTKGDMDGNAKIDVADALLALRIAIGALSATPEQISAAPVGSSLGKIDIRDAVAILQMIVGL